MDEAEEFTNTPHQRRTKILRACDECKRRKRRCEGPRSPGNKCSNCVTQKLKCTYETEQRKRGRLTKVYIENLERRIEMLEEVLQKLCPNPVTLSNYISSFDPEYAEYLTSASGSASVSYRSYFNNFPRKPPAPEVANNNAVLDVIHKVFSLSLSSDDDRRDEKPHCDSPNLLSEQLKSLSIRPEDNRFWGESSGVSFMQAAIELKQEPEPGTPSKPELPPKKLPSYYKTLPWNEEDDRRRARNFTFPPPHLITRLVDAYFDHLNLFYPLLHRPSFERNVIDYLHLRDVDFGSVLLLVCAVGSRYMDKIDAQSLENDGDPPFSAGWKWYKQVQVVRTCFASPPTLYDVQICCLAAEYITSCAGPQKVWMLTGIGIRLAQDVGAHRRRVPREKLTVEDELWKRVYWVLLSLDRLASMAIGRPCSVFDDQSDLDMPTECDDEYWEHPDSRRRFRQPEGVPSNVTTFNQLLKLTKIMAFAMNTIYSVKHKMWESVLKEWQQHVVAELDSALNNWLNSLPEHLRWDPNRVDDRSFKMSAILITFFYYAQILVHRPYISNATPDSSLSFPSLAICTSAARSCSIVLAQQMTRFTVVYPYMQMSCVSSMIVLLLHIGCNKRSGISVDPKEMRHLDMCVDVLKRTEGRSYFAGPVLDIFNALLSSAEWLRRQEDPSSHITYEARQCAADSQESVAVIPPNVSDHSYYLRSGNYGGGFGDLSMFEYNNQEKIYASQTYQVPRAQVENQFPSSRYHHYETSNALPFEDEHINYGMAAPDRPDILVDSNAMAIWMNMPTGFEINEWTSFLTNFTEYTNPPQTHNGFPLGNQWC